AHPHVARGRLPQRRRRDRRRVLRPADRVTPAAPVGRRVTRGAAVTRGAPMETRSRPTRAQLAQHLDATGITGRVATPRENNLAHIRRFLAQERQFDFGVPLTRAWTEESVFDLMVERVGISG